MSGGESRAAAEAHPHITLLDYKGGLHHETHHLRTRTSTDECIGTVRLTPEAEKVVRRLRFKTGLPIRQIVSEIIVQAENLIDISGDDDEDETDQ